MKILRLAIHIVNENFKEHNENKTGYGRSVWDITRYSSNNNNEYLYTYGNTQERTAKNIKILDGRLITIFKHIDKKTIKNIINIIKILYKFKGRSYRSKLAMLYYNSTLGYIKKLIKDIKPDLIHIHGLTHSTLPFIEASEESSIPFIVTLHGLNMNVFEDKIGKEFEINKISDLNKKGIFITVIGSGMIDNIKANCDIKDEDRIITINHGMDSSTFNFKNDKNEIKKKLDVTDKKVILSVGSLSKRRNQIALIRAISLLSAEEQKKISVYIIGDGPMKPKLEEEIKKLNLEEVIYLLGNKNHEELSQFYTIADITVILSKVEGFGRPILESFLFGVPVIAFSDLDAVNDLYKKGCMFMVNERTDEAVYLKIKEVLKKKIDKNLIKNHSSSKSWNEASKKYQVLYKKVIDDYKNNLKELKK